MGSRIWMGKAALQDIPHLCHNVIQRKVSSHMTITSFRITDTVNSVKTELLLLFGKTYIIHAL